MSWREKAISIWTFLFIVDYMFLIDSDGIVTSMQRLRREQHV